MIKGKLQFLNKDLFVFLFFFIFSFLFWIPTRKLPYHWDSAIFVINSAKNFLDTNCSNFINIGSDFAHPPFFTLLLSLWWRIFGFSIFSSHILNFFMLPLLLIINFLIAKIVFKSKSLAFFSSIFLGTIPFVLHEYGNIYVDLPMAILVNWSIYFWLLGKKFWSSIFLSLAILTKLPAIIVLLSYIIFEVNGKDKFNFKKYFYLLIPVLVFVIWLWYHNKITGWMFYKPERISVRPTDFVSFFVSLHTVLKYFFVSQGRYLISLLAMFSLVKLKIEKRKIETSVTFLFWIVFFGILFFTFMGELNFRYTLFMLPSFLVSSLYLIEKVFSKKNLWIFIFVQTVVFMYYWNPVKNQKYEYEFRPYEDLSYINMIHVFSESAKYLENNLGNIKIYGSEYDEIILQEPYQGYVKNGLNWYSCKDFVPIRDEKQIIYSHSYSVGQLYCRNIIGHYATKLLKRFVENGEWVEIYQIGLN